MSTRSRLDSELREKLESFLKRRLPDVVWESIAEDSKDYARFDADGALSYLKEEAGRLLRVHDERRVSPGKQPPSRTYKEPELPRREKRRSAAITTTCADLARRLGQVREFRARYVPQPLGVDDVAPFLRCEAYRLLSGTAIADLGMPTAGLAARQSSSNNQLIRLSCGQPMVVSFITLDCTWRPNGSASVVVPVPILPSTNEVPRLQFNEKAPVGDLRFTFEYLPGSVLADLVKCSEYLSWQFFWTKASALLFVLTDLAPPSPAIHTDVTQRQGAFATRGEIAMHIQPWASADTVRAVYQHARRWMLGRRSRALSEASLAAYEQLAQFRRRDATATWKELAARMEKRHRRHWRILRQVFLRTEEQLLRPRYAMGARLGRAK